MLHNYDATQTDPTDIARRDNIEFFVEKVITYEGYLPQSIYTHIQNLVARI